MSRGSTGRCAAGAALPLILGWSDRLDDSLDLLRLVVPREAKPNKEAGSAGIIQSIKQKRDRDCPRYLPDLFFLSPEGRR